MLQFMLTNINNWNCVCVQASDYRVYTQELLQAGDQVTLLLLLPPSEDLSCRRWPGEGDLEPHGLTVPLHIFELGQKLPSATPATLSLAL